jgi:cation transport regulator ChaB
LPAEQEELPGTLKRSPRKAQRTYEKTLDSADGTYDEETASHRVAYAAVKHSFEKVGDHWEEKDEKGPSDPRAESGGQDAKGETFGGGVVTGNTKKELYRRSKELGVEGRSKMSKTELARAIAGKQR